MGSPKNRLIEQPVPQALGSKTQPIRPGRANATFPDIGSQLEGWLGLILGTTPACTAAIIDSVQVLVRDISAINNVTSQEGSSLRSPLETLIRDLILIAMKLPPLCLAEESAVSQLAQVFEIIQLAHGTSSDDMIRGPATGSPLPHTLPGDVDDGAVELGPSGGLLELMQAIQALPGVGSQLDDEFALQVAQSLQAASKEDPVTLAQIVVALLPDEALEVLDPALNQGTMSLPGARFINTINDLEGLVGIDVIPDAILEGAVIDLIIRAIGATGTIDKESEKVLLELVSSLRDAVATGRTQTALQRAEMLGRIVVRQSDEPDTALPAPLNESYQRQLSRMKVLAGIK